jgi:hypothetical protein
MAKRRRSCDQRGIAFRLQIHREKNRHNGYLVRSKLPFGAATLATIPQLRAFAFSLSRNIDRADDLVQETLLRAAPGATEMADRSCRRTDFRSRYRRT